MLIWRFFPHMILSMFDICLANIAYSISNNYFMCLLYTFEGNFHIVFNNEINVNVHD